MPPPQTDTTIDKTISTLLIGLMAMLFVFLTIVGMQRLQASAEKTGSAWRSTTPETVEQPVDIQGTPN